jgi:uncharacterized small protein (DUF1192 family)
MAKLYELTGNLKELESSDFDEQTLKDTLEAVGGEFNDKAVALLKVIENLNGDTSTIDDEINRLKARKAAIANRQKSMRQYLLFNMQESGINKIECPLFTASLRKGSERVVIDDELIIPDEYAQVEVVTKIDKNAIKRDLKAGKEIPGARIERGETTILIK